MSVGANVADLVLDLELVTQEVSDITRLEQRRMDLVASCADRPANVISGEIMPEGIETKNTEITELL